MTVYTYFDVQPLSSVPAAALAFDSLADARASYRDFVDDCDRYDQTPSEAWVFIGEPTGDEDQLGYPDYPDYILYAGVRGGVYSTKA